MAEPTFKGTSGEACCAAAAVPELVREPWNEQPGNEQPGNEKPWNEQIVAPAPTPVERDQAQVTEQDPRDMPIFDPIDGAGSRATRTPTRSATPEASDIPIASNASPGEPARDSPGEPAIEPPVIPTVQPTIAPTVGASSRAPAYTKPPAADIVGDRYATENDLFGSPPPEASSLPASDSDPATTNRAEENSAADSEVLDLFGEPIPKAAAAAEPDTTPPVNEERSPAASDTAPEDTQTDIPAPQTEPQTEPDDAGLYGVSEASIPDPTDEKPSDTEPSEPVESEEDTGYDPFGVNFSHSDEQPSVLGAAGGLQSEADRTWRDNTAKFQCQARLVQVTVDRVTLRRASGAELIVPHTRLSHVDLQFVQQQVVALREMRARAAAAEKLAVAWDR